MKKYIVIADSLFRPSHISTFDDAALSTQIIAGDEIINSVWRIKTNLMSSQIGLIQGIKRVGILHD